MRGLSEQLWADYGAGEAALARAIGLVALVGR